MLSEHPNGAIEHIAHHEPAQAHYLLTNDAARLIGVAPQTIRAWERNGLLRAQRTESGVRLFRREDCETLKQQRDNRHLDALATVSEVEPLARELEERRSAAESSRMVPAGAT